MDKKLTETLTCPSLGKGIKYFKTLITRFLLQDLTLIIAHFLSFNLFCCYIRPLSFHYCEYL